MIKIDKRLIDEYMPKMRKYSFSTLMAIVRHSEPNSKKCRTKEDQLIEICGISRDSIRQAKRDLEELGLIQIYQNKTAGKFSDSEIILKANLITIDSSSKI